MSCATRYMADNLKQEEFYK
uniref:Uncharacterized protein n=1 Tax=Rhizophora mucronata TaxID=61149 RepID=A0A2P2J9P9_RHIMU